MRDRDLRWDGCVNVRDLGGLRTEDGGETRFDRVVRADSVRQLSDDGWSALVAYGVRTIVDLRWQHELEADPPRDLPLDVVHISLLDDPARLRPIDELVDAIKDPATRRRIVYLEFLERFHERFGSAVAAVARAGEGAVVVHCAGGVDRTGIVVALLLRLAGVGVEEIAADYAASEANWAPFVGAWIDEADDAQERERRRLLSICRPEAMASVLAELERRYGSVRDYVVAGGATAADVEHVRARLRA